MDGLKKKLKKVGQILAWSFLVLPASSNYKLEGFSFGNAGGNSIGSSNYEVNANIGEINNGRLGGNSYDLGAGLQFVQNANVPSATLDNPENFYNRLHLVISPNGNPWDTVYAVAISSDNFATMQYVKSDLSVGSSLATEDWMDYETLGQSGGVTINGLNPATTYKVKVKARQGKYTETGWGPAAEAATVNPTLTFDIDVAPNDIQTDGPYTINLSDLNPGSLVTSTDRVWVSLSTNAGSGGSVFIYGKNSGLLSVTAGYTIDAVAGDLAQLSKGFGIQGVGATQTSGGPFDLEEAYDLTANNVGLVDTSVRQLFGTAAPVTDGRGSFVIKAKSDNDAPAASDYSEVFTVIASANY